jgi:uncharacterized Zn finger protein
MSRRYYYEFFPRSKPRAAKGGIKAQSKRGAFGTSWWAKRWIAVLESFDLGARLSRGRSYARNGQVLSVDIDKGKVRAKVQGSRSTPYQVAIQVKTLSAADWKKVTQALGRQAIFTAKLLAGEMPEEIETVFTKTKLSLFPEKRNDLTTDCSCPDYSNPCKHIAAVYYLLGEEFDRDPFLLFKLRGIGREELLKQLGPVEEPGQPTEAGVDATADTVPEALPADVAAFWSGQELPEQFFGEVNRSPVHAALPKRLGNFPFWRGEEHFLDSVEMVYQAASQKGLEVFTLSAVKEAESS